MKSKLLIFTHLLFWVPMCTTAQTSSFKYTLSPTFPNVIVNNTRMMEILPDNRSLVFLDTIDTTYVCHVFNFYAAPSNTFSFQKKRLPHGLRISDMEEVQYEPWYCGSSNGVGAYGSILVSSNYSAIQRVHVFKLPDVYNLRKFTMAINMSNPYQRRIFAIGEVLSNTYIIDMDDGFGSYSYAPVQDSEYVDDVGLVEGRVVFATRDYKVNHSKINLRVSDVEHVLDNMEIDKQWGLELAKDEEVYGRVFITYLGEGDVAVCYKKFNRKENQYILCIHRVNLNDLYNGVTAATSQEMISPKGEELLGIIYDEERQVLVLLIDKDCTQSVFIHALPYSSASYSAVSIRSDEGDRYFSIDTLRPNYLVHDCSYGAWGGNKGFVQEFSNEGTVSASCFPYEKRQVELTEIKIKKRDNPMARLTGYRNYEFEELPWVWSPGIRRCYDY